MDELAPEPSLYWRLPGPASFIDRVSSNARSCRAIQLVMPERVPRGVWERVIEGIVAAGFSRDRVFILSIEAGTDIGMEIGNHFSVDRMSATDLAHWVGHHSAVLLDARQPAAAERIERYFAEFAKSATSDGGAHLYTASAPSGSDMPAEDMTAGVQRLVFDPWLTEREMSAYVGIRLLKSPLSDPLYNHLIAEFASFDPIMAEQLMRLSKEQVLNLPESLAVLPASASTTAWSKSTWASGTVSSTGHLHPLRLWYLSSHAGAQRNESRARLERMVWMGCMTALLPVIEERRRELLVRYDRDLTDLERRQELTRAGRDGDIPIAKHEVEFGNLNYYVNKGKLLRTRNAIDSAAVSLIGTGKAVRDELAHLRAPKPKQIQAFYAAIEAFDRAKEQHPG